MLVKNFYTKLALLALASMPMYAHAATTAVSAPSPTGGIFKVLLGLTVVLLVMAGITWLLKRMMPGVSGQQSVIKVVGGVSVGTRERVVVLEVAGRWLVVGVAAGQVHGIADLEKDNNAITNTLQQVHAPSAGGLEGMTKAFVPHFAQWITNSKNKILEQSNAKK
ncbi:MAG TPA: flagellar biosynthetic protein FliO [Methylotenera sp.]|nr:flagellar biosynthetic protein FliO [Methylotenera sp.]HPH04967.1 flagellar biosynthetic protein FliO [Methylotenera sp.]HPN00229.1 flagellar biosynthetic protein FliO [Methylotenera sp.]